MSTRGGKNANFKVHFTLMDIHPAPLARILVIFSILDQIRLSKDSSKRVELHAALFYLYTSVLMPDYCHQMLVFFAFLFTLLHLLIHCYPESCRRQSVWCLNFPGELIVFANSFTLVLRAFQWSWIFLDIGQPPSRNQLKNTSSLRAAGRWWEDMVA